MAAEIGMQLILSVCVRVCVCLLEGKACMPACSVDHGLIMESDINYKVMQIKK